MLFLKLTRWFILVFSIINFSIVFSSEKNSTQNYDFHFSSLDWPPYIGKDLINQGYVSELIHTAYSNSGKKISVKYYPWARAIHLASIGQVNGILPQYYTNERTKNYVFSDPFPGGPLVLLKLKTNKANPKTLMDLKNYKLGVVRSYANTKEIDAANFIQKFTVENDWENITILFNKRVDFIVIDLNVAKHLIKINKPEWLDQIDYPKPSLERKNLHIAFPKSDKNHKEAVKAFNQGLKKLIQSGQLDKIRKKYGIE